MRVYLKWQSGGDAATLELDGDDTLPTVRAKIAAACRVHPQLQQLVYKGKMLRESDNKTVGEYRIGMEDDLRIQSRPEPKVIRLNVGGTIYTTLLSTLRKVPESLLAKMFDGFEHQYGAEGLSESIPGGMSTMLVPKDVDGSFVIDRNGPLFRYALDYLRDVKRGAEAPGSLMLDLPGTPEELARLAKEADHLELPELAAACRRGGRVVSLASLVESCGTMFQLVDILDLSDKQLGRLCEQQHINVLLEGHIRGEVKAVRAARQEAKSKLDKGRRAAGAKKWASAIELLGAGLGVENTRDEELTAFLDAALGSSRQSMARSKLDEGQREAEAKQQESLESAIELLGAGLAVEGTTGADELTASLVAALESAQQAKAARDAAREDAEGWLVEVEILVAAKDFPGAIAALEAGLAVDNTQSADLAGRLRESKQNAERMMAGARQRALAKLREGQRAADAKQQESLESAIALLGAGLAVEGTGDDELTASLVAAWESTQQAKAARDAAREEAVGQLAEGDRLTAAGDFPSAIGALEAGLALDTQSEDLQARLQQSLEAAAEQAKAQADRPHHHHFAVGMIVDIETADGWERGVALLGPAQSGSADEMRVKFSDGEVDDWQVAEFVAVAPAEAEAFLDEHAGGGGGGGAARAAPPPWAELQAIDDPFADMEAMLDEPEDEPAADEPADDAGDVDPDGPFAAMEAMLAGGGGDDDEPADEQEEEEPAEDDDFAMLEAMLNM